MSNGDWADELIAFRRTLHRYPELSDEEHRTTAYLRQQLEQAGIRILALPLATGLVAEVGAGHPIVAIRADIDALPIQEQTGLAYASEHPGIMHACGHDLHATVIWGAARLLKQREAHLKGTVRIFFQPAEERATGAGRLIDAGALDDVAVIFGLHNKPNLQVGQIGVRAGPLMAAADGFEVKVRGRGSHAAVPERALDPLLASAHILTALQSIISRNVSPLDSAVVSVTRLAAGDSWNVIPEQAVFEGTIRSFSPEVRSYVRERFTQIVSGVAEGLGVQADIRWIDGPPVVHNDPAWTALVSRTVAALGLQHVVPPLTPAGEDFAFYQQRVPGVFLFLGTQGRYEWHHPQFDGDERALPIGARLFAELAEQALLNIADKERSTI